MIAIPFQVELLEPLLATSLQGDANSRKSYPFIPGGMIRGGIIAAYLNQNQAKANTLAQDSEARELFFDGSVRYLNAYPCDEQGQRTLPTPLSLFQDKDENTKLIHDKAALDFSEADLEEEVQLKRCKKPFCLLKNDEIYLHGEVEQVINVHMQRDRRQGTATKAGDGTVYQYEALAAGQQFAGVILVETESEAKLIEPYLQPERWLGVAQRAGYGRVKFTFDSLKQNWQEVVTATSDIVAGTPFTVTLLSNTLIRNSHGQYVDGLTPQIMAMALNLDAAHLTVYHRLPEGQTESSTQKARLPLMFSQQVRIGGFNRKWGLPLPQTVAIQAGSVFVFQSKVDIPAEAIQRLITHGIGERRVEGLGRLAFNWAGQTDSIEIADESEVQKKRPEIPLTDSTKKLVTQMVQRLNRDEAERQLSQAINQRRILRPPKRSQLGRLRVVIRAALAEGKTDKVLAHLLNLKAARKQFEQARLDRAGNTKPLFNVSAEADKQGWLNRLLQNPQGVWGEISFQPGSKKIGSITGQPDEAMSVAYTLRLIDGVLAKTAKEMKDE